MPLFSGVYPFLSTNPIPNALATESAAHPGNVPRSTSDASNPSASWELTKHPALCDGDRLAHLGERPALDLGLDALSQAFANVIH